MSVWAEMFPILQWFHDNCVVYYRQMVSISQRRRICILIFSCLLYKILLYVVAWNMVFLVEWVRIWPPPPLMELKIIPNALQEGIRIRCDVFFKY